MNMLMFEFLAVYAMLVYMALTIPILIVLGVVIWNWRGK